MKWISVKEKLPESPEKGSLDILIACYGREKQKYYISTAEFLKNNFYNHYGECLSIDDCYWPITHWMPLPPTPDVQKHPNEIKEEIKNEKIS